ncbi:MAG: carboxylesterase family protein [Sphingomonas fennica]
MVFGASGGGMKTAWLMASPAATGLIHRAGSQSGPCLRIMERDEASAISGRLLADVGLTSATVNDLRRMDVRRLLHAYHRIRIASPPRRFTHLAGFAPVIDPTLMPRHPFAPNSAPQAAAVPLLIGWNREDMAFFPGRDTGLLDLDEAGVAERVERLPIADAPRHLAAYRADDPDASPSRLLMRLVSDWSIGAPVLAQAARHSAAGRAPVFAYRFDHSSPALGGRVGAVHSSETGYVFATGGPFADPSPDAQALGRTMRDAWVHFATTGSMADAPPPVPAWPAYRPDNPAVLALATPPHVIDHRLPLDADWIPA